MTMGKKLLQQMPAVSKPPAKGLDPLFVTILARRGRVNFRPLSRSCHSCERTMARPFRRCFAWPGFPLRGITVAREPCSAVLSAQDAAVLAKRGTQTCGLGPFFNGCPSRAERGLEISPLAVVDVTRRCAFPRAGAHPPLRRCRDGLAAGTGSHQSGFLPAATACAASPLAAAGHLPWPGGVLGQEKIPGGSGPSRPAPDYPAAVRRRRPVSLLRPAPTAPWGAAQV